MPKRGPRTKSLELRFWKKVEKGEGCWKWTACKTPKGYGVIGVVDAEGRHRMVSANRASWIVHNGSIPDGLWVLHKCDNPECANPDHLYLGTVQDNMRDVKVRKRSGMLGHGERLAGEKNGRARLSWDDVTEIRNAHKNGTRQVDLAKKYKLNRDQIYVIVRNIQWKECYRPVPETQKGQGVTPAPCA